MNPGRPHLRGAFLAFLGLLPSWAMSWDPYVLQRIEYVYLWNREGAYEVISEGVLPANGTWSFEEITNSWRTAEQGYWSEVPWQLSGGVTCNFPAEVPYPPPSGPEYEGTVTIQGTLVDPRTPNPSNPPPPLRIETRISLDGNLWGPGPPSILPRYWNWGSFERPIVGTEVLFTEAGQTVHPSATWTGPVIGGPGPIAETFQLRFWTWKGSSPSEGDSAGFREIYIYPIYKIQPRPIQVDSLIDEDDGDYAPGDQSLREALKRAGQSTTAVQIPVTVSGTIALNGELTLPGTNGNWITLAPGAGRVTLDGRSQHQILSVGDSKKLAVSDLDFVNGSARESGGAISNRGNLTLKDCLFENNAAGPDGEGAGGAIVHIGTSLEIRDCYFQSNHADFGSGVYVRENALAVITNSVFVETGSLISVYTDGISHLDHCTLFSPTGSTLVHAGREGFGLATLSHCALGGQFSGFANVSGNIISHGFNAFQKPGSDFTPHETDIVDKFLHMSKTRGGGVSLLALSPCINAGDPAFDPGGFSPPLTEDVLGRPRVVGRIDIGALELREDLSYLAQAILNPDGDMNLNGVPDLVDALTGVDPTNDQPSEPPLEVEPPAPALPIPPGPLSGGPENADPEAGTAIVELRFDERAVGVEGVLQTSTDLVTWTSRATYRPLGLGQGYTRANENGAVFQGHARSGFGWFIREQVPTDTDGKVFARLVAGAVN